MNRRNHFPPGAAVFIAASLVSGAFAQAQTAPAQIPKAVIESVTSTTARGIAQGIADVLAAGAWSKKSYAIRGQWQIVARDGKRYIEFDERFKTKRGPDLKVYLSSRAIGELTDRTVAPNSLEIAPLKSPRGAQQYELPADLDLSDYRAIVIHCKRFSHLWGGANLAP